MDCYYRPVILTGIEYNIELDTRFGRRIGCSYIVKSLESELVLMAKRRQEIGARIEFQ